MKPIGLVGVQVLVEDLKHGGLAGARYIDDGKRVRLTTGEYSGEVLSQGKYNVKEVVETRYTLEELLKLAWKK